jgi:hypothetical protein
MRQGGGGRERERERALFTRPTSMRSFIQAVAEVSTWEKGSLQSISAKAAKLRDYEAAAKQFLGDERMKQCQFIEVSLLKV